MLQIRRSHLVMFAAVAILSIAARARIIEDRPLIGYEDNEDAASHVLTTCLCYDTVSISTHRFLPLFTFGDGRNEWIDDLPTASRFDTDGNCFYTSFPPGAFVFAYTAFKSVGIEPSPFGLRVLNIALSFAAAAAICWAVWATTDHVLPTNELRSTACLVAALVMFATPESLKSYTIGFWAQQIYQPILLVLAVETARSRFRFLYYGAIVIGPLLEWTAFPAAVGAAAICVLRYWVTRRRAFLVHAIATMAVTAIVGVGLVVWYDSAIGWRQFFSALACRSQVRAGGVSAEFGLFKNYARSIWPFLPLGILAAIALIRNLRSRTERGFTRLLADDSPYLAPTIFIGVMLAAITENFIMSGHASVYTFDRLKVVALYAYVVGIISSSVFPRTSLVVALLAALTSVGHFWVKYDLQRDYNSPISQQYRIVGDEIASTCPADVLPFFDQRVRGHLLYYARRNIVELPDMSDEQARAEMEAVCRRLGFLRARLYSISADGKPKFSEIDFEAELSAPERL